jgi:D-2-hydroxyacid dehydrogenase (NADP+)
LRVLIGVELPLEEQERLLGAFPEVEFVVAGSREEVLREAPHCEVMFGVSGIRELLDIAPRLRWVQVWAAGVNHQPLEELRARGILLTNASGVHGIPIAENILGMMLAFAIRLPTYIEARQRHEWLSYDVVHQKFELEGQTLLIIGLGGIGSTLAWKAHALGMHVIGIRNRPLPPPLGVQKLFTLDQLKEALAQADHVALCLPLTPATIGFLGEDELRQMKPTAYIYNVGRGPSIDREALLKALREGWIAGAGLDVTDPEPLPPDDPLWTFPNVILTQHTSGYTPKAAHRITSIFLENLRRFLANEPLINLVDYERRY